jgi:hypothetical protein
MGGGRGFGGVLMLENKPSEESNSKSMIKISGKSDSKGGGGGVRLGIFISLHKFPAETSEVGSGRIRTMLKGKIYRDSENFEFPAKKCTNYASGTVFTSQFNIANIQNKHV